MDENELIKVPLWFFNFFGLSGQSVGRGRIETIGGGIGRDL